MIQYCLNDVTKFGFVKTWNDNTWDFNFIWLLLTINKIMHHFIKLKQVFIWNLWNMCSSIEISKKAMQYTNSNPYIIHIRSGLFLPIVIYFLWFFLGLYDY